MNGITEGIMDPQTGELAPLPPTVGRIVHLDMGYEYHLAAIVSGVLGDGTVTVTVFPAQADPFRMVAAMGTGPGTIHWPER